MRVLAIAHKDLLQIARDRKSLIFLVLMPVLFTVFFGFAFGSSPSDARLPVGWLNRDTDGALSAGMATLLGASDAVRLVPLEEKEMAGVDARVRNGTLAAAVIVPAGFSREATAGQAPPIEVIAPAGPAGQVVTSAIQGAFNRQLGSIRSGQIGAEVVEAAAPFPGTAERRSFVEAGAALANAAWQAPALVARSEQATGASAPEKVPGGFDQSSPGMIVQFAVFSLITSAMVLVLERKSRTLQRLLMTSVRPAEAVAGHLLAMFTVVFLQEVLLVVLGQLAFGVNYLREPAGTLLMMVVVALWASSLGLLIGSLARSEEHVVMYALVAMFFFSALGGAWFPLALVGRTFSTIGHLLPTAWAMEGYQNIVLRGLGLGSLLLPVGILLAYTLAFFGLAVWRFRMEP